MFFQNTFPSWEAAHKSGRGIPHVLRGVIFRLHLCLIVRLQHWQASPLREVVVRCSYQNAGFSPSFALRKVFFDLLVAVYYWGLRSAETRPVVGASCELSAVLCEDAHATVIWPVVQHWPALKQFIK